MSLEKMGKEADKTIDRIVDAFRVIAVGAIVIFAAYKILDTVLNELPTWIRWAIYAALAVFVYAVRNKIISFTKKILE